MSTIKANAILDASGGNTATFNGIPLRQGAIDPENRIINGAFDFWQRGTSTTGGGYATADRWGNAPSGGTVTQSRQAFTLGDTLGSNNPTYFLRTTVSGQTLSSSYAFPYQRIESVRSYAGQTITVLGWARRSSGTGNMAVEAEQVFGTGGSPSANVDSISVTTVTLTGSFAPFAVTMTIPSITGKTLGTNGNDSLSLNFWASAGSNFNGRTNSLGLQTIGVDLWGIHIKVGTHTTAATDLYKQPEMGPELVRCYRYYEQAGPSVRVVVSTCANTSTTSTQGVLFYKVIKRVAPTITFGGAWRTLGANQGASLSAVTANGDQNTSNSGVYGTGTTFVQGQANMIQSNDAITAYYTIDAEL